MERQNNVPILTRAWKRAGSSATNVLVQNRRVPIVPSRPPAHLRDGHVRSYGTILYSLCPTDLRSKARSNSGYWAHRNKTVHSFSAHAQSPPERRQYVGCAP